MQGIPSYSQGYRYHVSRIAVVKTGAGLFFCGRGSFSVRHSQYCIYFFFIFLSYFIIQFFVSSLLPFSLIFFFLFIPKQSVSSQTLKVMWYLYVPMPKYQESVIAPPHHTHHLFMTFVWLSDVFSDIALRRNSDIAPEQCAEKISGGFKLRIVKQEYFRKLCDENDEMGSGAFGTLLLRISQGKRPLGRPKRKEEENVKMKVKGIGCGRVDRINLAQDRGKFHSYLNTLIKIRVP